MDAHLRYFKQGYELLHQMEPYIHQVLAYAQQSRERSNYEQAALTERMQEFKRQIDRESQWSSNGSHDSPNGDGIQAVGRSSHKMIDAVMQSAAKGKVETIRQGYLSKRSSNLRGDWKRRFFVLDSRGMLYYYRKQLSRSSVGGSQNSSQRGHSSSEQGSGLLSRWFSSHYHGGVHGGVHDEKSVARHTVNLLTSTIKIDADQSDLRFCFRIISPTKNYTLQAESAMDQIDWIEKITGVIASLLSSQSPDQRLLTSPTCSSHHRTASDSSFGSSSDLEHLILEESSLERNCTGHFERSTRNSQQRFNPKHEKPIDVLRKVCGNHICADCGASEPDWASLNLGILVCIECSGVHRNLGVHISKVRSLTLDVRVWEPSVINLFQSLGNAFVNTIWEELLPSVNNGKPEETSSPRCHKSDRHHQQHPCSGKPKPTDPIAVKEKFIQAKYAEKMYVRKSKVDQNHLLMAKHMWDSVQSNDKRAVYRDIVASNADVNTVYGRVSFSPSLTLAKAMLLQEQPSVVMDSSSSCLAGDSLSGVSAVNLLSPVSTSEMDEVVEGFSLLHVACQTADVGMMELLLQYGASVNCIDSEGKTPLHYCILRNRNVFARLLLSRGADPTISDKNGKTPLQYVVESGGIEDEEILVLLQDTNS